MIELKATPLSIARLRNKLLVFQMAQKDMNEEFSSFCAHNDIANATLVEIFDDSILVRLPEKTTEEVVADLELIED